MYSPLGLVTGNGQFPIQCIKEAKIKGLDLVVVAHIGETDPTIKDLVDNLIWVRVGQLGKIINFFKKYKVKSVIFTGGIKRVSIFQGARPDIRALKVISRVGSIRDDEILRGIAKELTSEGMTVYGVQDLLSECLPERGCLTRLNISNQEISSGKVGWKVAGIIGELDIGQTVCVKDGVVIAVEGIEGTDSAIIRAGELAGAGIIVVKRAKPQQDTRLDLPAVGIQTIKSLITARAKGLIIEHQRTLLLNPQEIVNMANSSDLFIEVW